MSSPASLATARWEIHKYTQIHLNQRVEALKTMQDVMRKEISEHLKDIDYSSPRDLIDSYLAEMKEGGDPEFHQEQLVMVGMDLMGAGSDTTSTNLMWTVLFLATNPEVQERCHQEVGGGGWW